MSVALLLRVVTSWHQQMGKVRQFGKGLSGARSRSMPKEVRPIPSFRESRRKARLRLRDGFSISAAPGHDVTMRDRDGDISSSQPSGSGESCDGVGISSRLHFSGWCRQAAGKLGSKNTVSGIAFRGHDETQESINRGNFVQVIKLLRTYNKEVDEVVLENAPGNAMYISPSIQKDLLSIMSRNVQDVIRKEIDDSKYCIIVDECRDESKREQMAFVIRFVDVHGFVRERFLDIVHVTDASVLTLNNKSFAVLSRHNLSIQDMWGQRYDGASNMRGEWKSLKTLFLNECSQAYYVHCFAHKLQLVLVATSKEVKAVHNFFNELIYIVNTVGASSKCND
ncbi:hypothetical protein KSP39_PZI000417 [Platanthera zijinensis]|uniref:DUF4371 domain-containing protein n=1 Tax=Platanthera zijinensis TaxID=2320716 RepID=A0AAP0GF98_9ASPA